MPPALAAVTAAIAAKLTTAAIIKAVVSIAISVALSFIGQLLAPKPPTLKPSDGQANLRQAIGPRVRIYGYAKHGGQMFFFKSKDGNLWVASAIHHEEIEEVVRYYISNAPMTQDGDGFVTTAPYVLDGNSLIKITEHLGTADQTADSRLTTAFSSEWTSAHRLRGLAYFVANMKDTPASDFNRIYPRGRPEIVPLIKGANQLIDPRGGAVGWSDNAGVVIYDFLLTPSGFNLSPSDLFTASFQAFADLCDEDVPLDGGGTEKRWRLWLKYSLEDEPKATLALLLAGCAAELYLTTGGKIGIRGGEYKHPTVTLADAHILEADFRRGANALAKYNTLRFEYTDPVIYKEIEGDPWVDADLLAAVNGVELAESAIFLAAPSHSQGRRLAKIKSAADNPEWFGEVKTTLAGLDAWESGAVNLTIAELNISGPFAVKKIVFLDDGATVSLSVQSQSAAAYVWTTAEEGEAPNTTAIAAAAAGVGVPTGLAANPIVRTLTSGSDGLFFEVTWGAPSRTSLSHEIEFKRCDETAWQRLEVNAGVSLVQTPVVDENTDYDFRVRAVGPAGTASEWASTVSANSGQTGAAAPGVASGGSVVGSVGKISVSWTQPTSSTVTGADIRRYTSNTFASSIKIGTKSGGPSASLTYEDTAAGDGVIFHYWAVTYNSDGVRGSELYCGSDEADPLPDPGEP